MCIGTDSHGEIRDYNIYPLIIIKDRYNGTYSGGHFTVWNLYPEALPEELFDSDTECHYFWNYDIEKYRGRYGVGNTIQEAIDMLYYTMTDPSIEVAEECWLPKSYIEDNPRDIECMLKTVTVEEMLSALEKYNEKRKEYEV